MVSLTKKLFYDNIYLKEFTSNILSIEEIDKQFHILLDQTAFYPEGGGQPSDIGTIENIQVLYVYKKDNKIYHILREKPKKLHDVKCIIDWEKRFDHMQQHLGQHILSGCFHKFFNAKTVGFHLGEAFVTIDIALKTMSDVQAEKIEYFANQVIFSNLKVKQFYPTPKELSEMVLRKSPKVIKNIRIVEIDQFDFSPCGGTHLSHTGEVGMIKIRKWEKNKGNIRVEFICGNRALKDFYWKNNYINKISNLLSSKDIDTLHNVERIFSEYSLQKKEIRNLKETLLDYEASTLHKEASMFKDIKFVHKIYNKRDFWELKILASKIVAHPNIIVLFGTKNEKAQMILSCSKNIQINMNELFKMVCPIINGKGGGNSHTAQGGGDNILKLEDALEEAKNIILHNYL